MTSSTILSIIQIVVSTLLALSILFQQRGSGAGSVFGGGGTSYHTKRGFEKALFTSTIVLGIIFAILTILAAYLASQSSF